jgi:hypothetical protein
VGARIGVWYIKIKTCWYILPPCLALSDTTVSTSAEIRKTARADFLYSAFEDCGQGVFADGSCIGNAVSPGLPRAAVN